MELKFFTYKNKKHVSQGYEMKYPFEWNLAQEISEDEYKARIEERADAGVPGFLIDGVVHVCWTMPERTQSGHWRLRAHNLSGSYTGNIGSLDEIIQELKRIAKPPTIVSEQQAYDAGNYSDN